MKASGYNTCLEAGGGGTIIYNTLYGSMTQLTSDESSQALAALDAPDQASPEMLDTLSKQKHLVDDDVNEHAIITERRAAGIKSSGRLDVVVMPTLDCNFDCIYCYEKHEPGSKMPLETEKRLVTWLEHELPTARLVLFHWYGGEPLLDVPLIHRVSKRAAEIVADSNTSLSLHMTTNGYLLAGDRLDKLLDAGIKYYQVTIDGPPQTHNRMRPLRGGGPSFEVIVQNVINALQVDPDVRMTV